MDGNQVIVSRKWNGSLYRNMYDQKEKRLAHPRYHYYTEVGESTVIKYTVDKDSKLMKSVAEEYGSNVTTGRPRPRSRITTS